MPRCRNCDDDAAIKFGLCAACRRVGRLAFAIGAGLAGLVAGLARMLGG
jgi:hypothetical protein